MTDVRMPHESIGFVTYRFEGSEMKRCPQCQITKPKAEFNARKSRASGISSWCKVCNKLKNQAWCKANALEMSVKKAAYREKNAVRIKGYLTTYRDENRDALNLHYKDYAKRFPHKKHANSVARRARKLNATPAWANQGYIALFYEMAKLEADRTGLEVHVDHIVPLSNPLVCGLHVEHNLQLLTKSANLRKSNLVWPHMP
jgi:hypothetical protein